MLGFDTTGLARPPIRDRARRARVRGLAGLALAALLAGVVLFGLPRPPASAGAATPGSSTRVTLARLALQQSRLTAADGAAGDIFGYSVAVSGDTALVGAPWHDGAGVDGSGAAYVFIWSGGSWTLQTELTAADAGASDGLGDSVALSGDTALVGAPYHNVSGKSDAGAAYVFVRSGAGWVREARLIAADGAAGDIFGDSVALSGDKALVGATAHDVDGRADAGAAYVFVRVGGSWTQQDRLTAEAPAAADNFGRCVALFGTTALVGAPLRDVSGKADAGAAYLFTRSGSSWTRRPALVAADAAAGDTFGWSASVSGTTALIGAPLRDFSGMDNAGAVYVFARSGASWTQHAAPTAPDGAAGDQFGRAVALSGNTALIGAPWHSPAATTNAGAAYLLTRSGTTWVQQAKVIAPDGAAGDVFGRAVAVSGGTLLVGAPNRDLAAMDNAGGAYVFLSQPSITGLKPASGKRGATVTISGVGFGATRGSSAVRFGGKKCTQYASWSDAAIRCKVPAAATYGTAKVTVTTASGTSGAMSFTVMR
jgi:hypothetical protein